MMDWLKELPDKNRNDITKKYEKAKDLKEKIRITRDWHPKGYINDEPVKNLEEYFLYLRHSTNPTTWFRGESREYENLIPTLYRDTSKENITKVHQLERKYFFEFQRRAIAFGATINPDDKWSTYFLIQHYGGPTRLLDWTQNAAVALYFALDTNRESVENSFVILLQPTVLADFALKEIGIEKEVEGSVFYPGEGPTDKWLSNIVKQYENSNSNMPNSPIALLPPYSDQRIIAQSSCFTLFGKEPLGFIADGKQLTCPCCDQKIINKVVIDGTKKDEIRNELNKIGITSSKVYPGLDGLCKELTEEIINNKK